MLHGYKTALLEGLQRRGPSKFSMQLPIDRYLAKSMHDNSSNHATFYVSQLIATRVLAGDVDGATAAVQNYFSRQFLDQVSASGEQPFEAVRTRPFHYRCFNLEAMIVSTPLTSSFLVI